MVLTPAACAFFRQAPPESESRLTISRTLTPELIMLSQMVPNFDLSPLAFWMSDCRPAASNADFSSGRSLASQRGEVEASGRMTPTLPAPASPPPPVSPPPSPSSPPQADSSRVAAASAAAAMEERLRMDPGPFLAPVVAMHLRAGPPGRSPTGPACGWDGCTPTTAPACKLLWATTYAPRSGPGKRDGGVTACGSVTIE